MIIFENKEHQRSTTFTHKRNVISVVASKQQVGIKIYRIVLSNESEKLIPINQGYRVLIKGTEI